jgi:hypothetical protein
MGTTKDEQVICEFNLENTARSIFHQVKGLGRLIPRGKARYFEKLSVIAVKEKVIFRCEGVEFYIDAKPTRELIFEVYYTDLKNALEKDKSIELKFQVKDNTLLINDQKLTCMVKELSKSQFDIEAGLGALNFGETNPLNPSWATEVYSLKSTGESIHINTIQREAEKAALLLKKYNVHSNEILSLMMKGVTGN